MKQQTIFDVLIVGGGLSGLYVGHSLHQRRPHCRWKLLEASDRLGGRLHNAVADSANKAAIIDMGGAWIWPEHQPHVREFVVQNDKKFQTFPQPDDPMSTRLVGGAAAMIEHLVAPFLVQHQNGNKTTTTTSISYEAATCSINGTAAKEDTANIQLNAPVTSCKFLKNEKLVKVETANGDTYLSKQVVFAVPPRLLSESVTFDPPLSPAKQAALAASRTWMAGVTKVALVYDATNHFWDRHSSNMGLPSFLGPAFQVYDSSTSDGSVHALTFFALAPPPSSNENLDNDDAALAQKVAQQMAAVWKSMKLPEHAQKAHSYSSYHVQRWPLERFISGSDTHPTTVHPHPHPVRALAASEWDHTLHFAGTECDLRSPGVMEGAIGAAKRVVKVILSKHSA